jgi:hypothetical protein
MQVAHKVMSGSRYCGTVALQGNYTQHFLVATSIDYMHVVIILHIFFSIEKGYITHSCKAIVCKKEVTCYDNE